MKNICLRILLCGMFCVSFTFIYSSDAQTSTKNRFIYPEYSKTISMDFKNASLTDVLKIFSQQSGMNFIASEEVGRKQITLYLDQVPVEQALEQILRANNLTYEIQPDSDIFIVKTVSKPEKDLMTRVYNLKHATVNSSKLKSTIALGSDSGGQSTTSSSPFGAPSSRGAGASGGTGIMAAVSAILSTSGNIVEDPRTNSLIVTDHPSQFPVIEQTIARLDVPIPQVLIEVEMLDISENTADLIGIKPGSTPLDFTGGVRQHYYPWDQNKLLDKGLVSDPAYTVGTINASGLTATLQFLRTQTDTKNLARPRLLTLNNETAEIKISTDEAIGISTNTGATEGIATQSVEAERVLTGVFLTVTPQVNLLTKTITMAVAPRVIEARAGSTFSGQSFKDPEERGTQSVLRVQDGETIILGGLLRKEKTNIVTKIPILGDIPFIGSAFRHRDTDDTDRELVIFITPHIVPYSEERAELVLTNNEKIVREQTVPIKRKQEIDKALSQAESQRKR